MTVAILQEAMADKFGKYCTNGSTSHEYLNETILPHVNMGGEVILDFSGVRMVNSSFSNAFIANFFRCLGDEGFSRLKIRNAAPMVKTELSSSMAYGLKLRKEDSMAVAV